MRNSISNAAIIVAVLAAGLGGWAARASLYPSFTLVVGEGGVLKNVRLAPYDGFKMRAVGGRVTVENTDLSTISALADGFVDGGEIYRPPGNYDGGTTVRHQD